MISIRTSIQALCVCALVAGCSSDNNTAASNDAGTGTGASDNGTGGKGTGGGATGGASSGGAAGKGTGGVGMGTGGAGTGGAGTGGKGSGGKAGGSPEAGVDGGMDSGSSGSPEAGVDGGGIPAAPKLGMQIDRMGRPAINTALNNTFNADATSKGQAKDQYNAALPATWATLFTPEIEKNLAILDSLDANCGNQLLYAKTAVGAARYAPLAGVLADDQLYVNSAATTCGVYLGVEAEYVGAVQAGDGKCGGRSLTDDVIERSYSVLAAGILAGVDDGIAMDDTTPTAAFPFLAAPSP